MTYDVRESLHGNVFTKEGYAFIGWAASASDDVVWQNRQMISNLASGDGEVVELYAVWGEIELEGCILSEDGVPLWDETGRNIMREEYEAEAHTFFTTEDGIPLADESGRYFTT